MGICVCALLHKDIHYTQMCETMCIHIHAHTHELLSTQPGVHPSDTVLSSHMTVGATGLLFSSCSSSSSSSPRGSHCYARGSERFTFNFHFSCFGSRFTRCPEVFFLLPPLPALMKSQCDVFSLRCSSIHNAVWHYQALLPSVFTMYVYRWPTDKSVPLIKLSSL